MQRDNLTQGLKTTTANIGLPQAGLTMELQAILLSTYLCAWRQAVAFYSRLRQATAYLINAEALGVDAFLGYSLSHSFIRYKNHLGTTLNFETTTGNIMPDQFYLETLPTMAKAKHNKIYISNISKKQIIASVMVDLAVSYVSEHWLYDKAFIKECMIFDFHCLTWVFRLPATAGTRRV